MIVLETERLILRKFSTDDAEFVLALLNEPSFLRFIGDKGVRTLEDARNYIVSGPLESYEQHGFGLWVVEVRDSKVPIGICGLLKRNSLDHADVGFAFLPEYWSRGYAHESASAVLTYSRNVIGLNRILAITNQDNTGSIKVLERIGLKFERMIRLSDGDPEIKLFASEV
ncbi:MAG: GNAT family N-acetyltransferase [Pyrinomonadaceae bacterium]